MLTLSPSGKVVVTLEGSLHAEIGLHVARVKGRHKVSNIVRPGIELLDTEKVLLSIAAKDLGGVARAIPAEQFAWESSDSGIVTLEAVDDGLPLDPYSRVARTPTAGSVVVTVRNIMNGDTEELPITVAFSAPGEIGLSAGAPVPE